MKIGRLEVRWDRLGKNPYLPAGYDLGSLELATPQSQATVLRPAPVRAWRSWRIGRLSIRWRTSP